MEKSLFNPELLEGKVAFITGGSNGGMLLEIAKEYLKHSAKAVVLVARKQDKLNELIENELKPFIKAGSECIGLKGDVRDSDNIKQVVSTVIEKYGSIDVLVNGAAGNFLCPAEKLSINGFKTVMEIDTIGTFNVSKEVFLQAMQKQRSGVIVNITTNLHYNGTPMVAHAGAAKAAVDALTKHLAVEWGPYNVRVMGLCPGFITGTEGMSRLSDLGSVGDKDKAAKSRETNSELDQGLARIVPLGRYGDSKDIANTAVYLASDASSYLTGSILMVDGGSNLTCPNFLMHYPKFIDMYDMPRRAKM